MRWFPSRAAVRKPFSPHICKEATVSSTDCSKDQSQRYPIRACLCPQFDRRHCPDCALQVWSGRTRGGGGRSWWCPPPWNASTGYPHGACRPRRRDPASSGCMLRYMSCPPLVLPIGSSAGEANEHGGGRAAPLACCWRDEAGGQCDEVHAEGPPDVIAKWEGGGGAGGALGTLEGSSWNPNGT